MAKKRSLVIALTLLSLIAVAAILCLIWLVPGRSGTSSRVGINAGGISLMSGGFRGWLYLSVFGGGGLSILFVLGAFVALLVGRRDRSE